MQIGQNIELILLFLSSITVFIFAIDSLSKAIISNATNQIRVLISKLVSNRIVATFVGAISTALFQSSSAITSITVLLVSSGVLSFKNSLGVMFGANIGTTVTAQLALIDSSIIAPVLIIVGFIFSVLSRKTRSIGKIIFFLGFILFALNLLSSTLIPLKQDVNLISLFANLSNPILVLLISFLFTLLVQSSSITTGIVIVLAQSGLIQLDIGIAMILGANIGSSSTAYFVSSNLDIFARRAGLANLMFNLLGASIFFILLSPFADIIELTSESIPSQIANAHFFFNLIITIIFLVLLDPFAKFVEFLVKGDEEEILFKTKYISGLTGKATHKNLDLIRKELAYSVNITAKMFGEAVSLFERDDKRKVNNITKLESLNDYLDDEISEALFRLSDFNLKNDTVNDVVELIKVSNAIEQLGDLGFDFSKIALRFNEQDVKFTIEELMQISILTKGYLTCSEVLEKFIVTNSLELNELLHEQEIIMLKEIDTILKSHITGIKNDKLVQSSHLVDVVSVIELSIAKVRSIRLYLKNLQEKI